nr:pectinesterase inhibitor-like [Ipomoea batatas]
MAKLSICSASIILWVLFLCVKPIASQQSIENLCAKAIDKNFCLQVLAPSPSQSLDDLLKTAVANAATNALLTSTKIQEQLTEPNSPDLTVAYFQCSNYYSAGRGSVRRRASQRLGSSPAAEVVNDVASAASTVEKDADFCEASFKNGASRILSSDNRTLKLSSNVIKVVCAAI